MCPIEHDSISLPCWGSCNYFSSNFLQDSDFGFGGRSRYIFKLEIMTSESKWKWFQLQDYLIAVTKLTTIRKTKLHFRRWPMIKGIEFQCGHNSYIGFTAPSVLTRRLLNNPLWEELWHIVSLIAWLSTTYLVTNGWHTWYEVNNMQIRTILQ